MPLTKEEIFNRQALLDAVNAPGIADDESMRLLDERDAIGAASDMRDVTDFDNRISTTPLPGVEPPVEQAAQTAAGGVVHGRVGTEKAVARAASINKSAAAGTDVNNGLPLSIRTVMSMADLSPEVEVAVAEYMVRQLYDERGIPVPEGVSVVYQDTISGEPAYLHPNADGTITPRFMDPDGIQFADMGDFLGTGQQIALEALGAVGGALGGAAASTTTGFGAAPFMAWAAGAAGAGGGTVAGLTLRRAVMEEYDVPEHLIKQATDDRLFGEALLSVGFQAAGPVFAGLIRKWRNIPRWVDEGELTPEGLTKIKDSVKSVNASIAHFQEKYNVPFNLTIGSRTGDATVQIAEATIKGRLTGNASLKVNAQELEAARNTAVALDAIHGAVTPSRPNVATVQLADDSLAQTVSNQLRRPIVSAETTLAKDEHTLDGMRDKLASLDEMPVFTRAQSAAKEAVMDAATTERKAWDSFRELTGFTGYASEIHLVNGSNSNIKMALKKLSGEAQEEIGIAHREAQHKFMSDLGVNDVAKNRLAPSPGLTADTLSLEPMHIFLSKLKTTLRKVEQGTSTSGYAKKDLENIIKAIEDDLAEGTFRNVKTGENLAMDSAHSDAIREAWGTANAATSRRHNVYKNETIEKILEVDAAGRYRMGPETLQDYVFRSKDASVLNEFMDVVGRDPVRNNELLTSLGAKYEREVFTGTDGVWDASRHNAFLVNHRPHMNVLMGEDGAKNIVLAGDLGEAVRASTRRLANTTAELEKAYGRKMVRDDYNPGNMATSLLSLKPAQINSVMTTLGAVGGLKEEVLDEVLSNLTNKLVKQGKVPSGGLHNFLGGKAKQAQLGALFGKEYVADLKHLHTILQGIEGSKGAKAFGQAPDAWWIQSTRAMYGALSSFQRKLSVGVRLGRGNTNSRHVRALLDPSSLNGWTKLSPDTTSSDALYTAAVELFGREPIAAAMRNDHNFRREVRRRKANSDKIRAENKERARPPPQQQPAPPQASSETAMAREIKRRHV